MDVSGTFPGRALPQTDEPSGPYLRTVIRTALESPGFATLPGDFLATA